MTERQPSDTAQLKIRVKESVRQQLEEAANENDWTLNREIARRLEDSLRADRAHGSRATTALVSLIAAAIDLLEAETGKGWHEDEDTFFNVRGAVLALIDRYDPGMTEQERAEIKRLEKEAEKAREASDAARKARADYRINELGWSLPDPAEAGKQRRGMFGKMLPPLDPNEPIAPLGKGPGLLSISNGDQTDEQRARDEQLSADVARTLDESLAASTRYLEAMTSRSVRKKAAERTGWSLALKVLGFTPPSPTPEE